MNSRSSIRDVAEQAGVSHTTASMALRQDTRIPKKTRTRVEKAAAKLGYSKHALVSSLMAQLRNIRVRQDTSTIGFVTAWPTRDGWKASPHHRLFFAGVEERAREQGYKIEMFWLREPGMTSRRMSQILYTRGIRGLILQALEKSHGHLSLDWKHFATVAKGLTITRPLLHRVISSHFEDMRLVVHHLKKHGYHRPGLVLDKELDARVDHAWLAAYLLYQNSLPARNRVPALILDANRPFPKFSAWLNQNHPGVILFTGVPAADWTGEMKLRVPDDVGLVHLDWTAESGPLAGIDANAKILGAEAVDLLVGQLHAHEYGIPRREKIVSVSGSWINGPSLRKI